VKGNLEMFPLLLGLKSEEGYQQVHLELQNKIIHFPFLSTRVCNGEEPLL
jgi:hypothetical protein